jgi:hypothetical protein
VTEDLDSATQSVLTLLTGDPRWAARLAAGERIRVETPFSYPGRFGVRVALLVALSGNPAVARISDEGGLIRSLAEQGMALEVDSLLSRTVFHAVREHEGAGISSGQVHLECPVENVDQGFWRLLQLIAELIGLRHAKYKDALVQLERRQGAEPGFGDWRPS